MPLLLEAVEASRDGWEMPTIVHPARVDEAL